MRLCLVRANKILFPLCCILLEVHINLNLRFFWSENLAIGDIEIDRRSFIELRY